MSMNNTASITNTAKPYLGFSRYDCTQQLAKSNIDSIAFAHWLAIPSQRLLLVFRHQRCVAVDNYQLLMS